MPVDVGTLDQYANYQVKTAFRRLQGHANDLEVQIAKAKADILRTTGMIPTMAQIAAALSATGSSPLNLTGLVGAVPPPPPLTPNPTMATGLPPTPPAPTPAGTCQISLPVGQPAGIPAAPDKRWFRGNFGGIRVPGLPGIPDGPNNTIPGGDTSMLWTPLFNRYPPEWQATALTAYVARGLTHFDMNWASSRADGLSPAQFVALAQQVQAAGLFPVIELAGKGAGATVTDYINIANEIIGPAIAAGVIPIAYMGKELNLALSPVDLQAFIDACAPTLVAAGTNVYVHFSSGYMSWQVTGPTAAFWQANIGKLTGFLYQQDPSLDCPTLQGDLTGTILTRCAGNDTMPTDCGFGHPVDCVAYELTAEAQFFPPNITEQAGDLVGFHALCSPPGVGPAGTVSVMGFGNGATTLAGGII
jgi:hypothetical protein